MRTSAPEVLGGCLFLALLAGAPSARAFSGFYARRSGAARQSDSATIVVMRDGDRTVVSVRNDYRGPPEDLAFGDMAMPEIAVPGVTELV